jgi:cell wall-active antibiotic response 4TMS protein YvqF
MNQHVDTRSLMWGLVLMGIGVLFLLDRFGVVEVDRVVRLYWPMIFVVIGVAKLARRNVWGGFWFIVTGVWLEIAHAHLFGLTFQSSWPLLLIAFGAAMIARTLIESARRNEAN